LWSTIRPGKGKIASGERERAGERKRWIGGLCFSGVSRQSSPDETPDWFTRLIVKA
jgi:hypothetical protein